MRAPQQRIRNYRADIDGLRAVAIVPVLLYHAGFEFAGGGYVGVDVFLVVSGFLITSLILADLEHGRFSVIEFYERRIRRLFPALFTVLAACAVAASILLLPEELRRFGGSLLATALFSSNVFFWLETGYFTTAAEQKPLLHTWSLGVEEQFYLLVPLMLMLGMRLEPRRLAVWTLALLLVSLVAGVWMVRQWPSAAFYLTPFRFWELALGVLLALPLMPAVPDTRIRNAAAWLGLGLIALSVFALSWRSTFPGWNALVPCAGAALVVWSGTGADTPVKRLLSLRPIVFLGLISYSLYLWHWPLLTFARYYTVRELSVTERVALLSVAIMLAVLSWRFIEQPFRGRNRVLARRGILVAAGTVTAFGAVFALVAVGAQGWPNRIPAEAARLAAAANDVNPRRAECSFLEAEDVLRGHACRLGAAPGHAPSFVVWGDSHADALMSAFDHLASEHGLTGLYLGRIGCPPLLGVDRPGTEFHCRAFNDAARQVIARSEAQIVVLVARWSHYSSEPIFGREPRTRVVVSDGKWTDTEHNDIVLAEGLRRTLDFLNGHDVFVVSTVPEVGYEVPEVLARIRYLGRTVDIRPGADAYRERQRAVQSVLDAEQRRTGFTQVRPAKWLCDARYCRVMQGDRPLYFDSHHLSTHGADFIAGVLEPIFSRRIGDGRAPSSAGGRTQTAGSSPPAREPGKTGDQDHG